MQFFVDFWYYNRMVNKSALSGAGRGISEIIAHTAYKIWQEEKFRDMIKFKSIPQIEQDRIFNEIEIALLGLLVLYVDNLSMQIDSKNEQKLLKNFQEALIEGFLSIYHDYGVEKKFIGQWRVLIDTRLKEYRDDLRLLMTESQEMEEFKKDERFRSAWARVETITLDGLSHIRKGKWDQKDPLRKYLQEWVIGLDQVFAQSVKNMIFHPAGFS